MTPQHFERLVPLLKAMMLHLSNKTGVELPRADGYVYFVHR